MGKNVRLFTQLKQMSIRYALFFLQIGSHQTKLYTNAQAADMIGQGIGEKTMYESHL